MCSGQVRSFNVQCNNNNNEKEKKENDNFDLFIYLDWSEEIYIFALLGYVLDVLGFNGFAFIPLTECVIDNNKFVYVNLIGTFTESNLPNEHLTVLRKFSKWQIIPMETVLRLKFS